MYYNLEIKEVLKLQNSSLQGLNEFEAKTRLEKYGKNKLIEGKKQSKFLLFLKQFNNPLVLILIAAIIVSIFLKEVFDAAFIFVIVILNAILGFVQEYRAERAMELLKKLTSLKARVVRDNSMKEINAEFLVPGDIVVIETGDKVPADIRIIESYNLETNEASLTGESTPVSKQITKLKSEIPLAERTNMIYSGTIITKGRAKGIVVETGMKTEFGKIAHLLQKTEDEKTPLQIKLDKFGKKIGVGILIIAAIVFLGGILREGNLADMFLISISLAVAAIPEGLPAIVTITLALGTSRMIKRNVLVRKLTAVESLGSITVICSDKTGTMTKGEMTVKKIYSNYKVIDVSGSGYSLEGDFHINNLHYDAKNIELLLICGVLNNNSNLDNGKVIGDPTEASLIVSAAKSKLNKKDLENKYKKLDEIPFSSEEKLMYTLNKAEKNYIFLKGAPEIVLKKCDKILVDGKIRKLTKDDILEILDVNKNFTLNALRVLGFAYKETKNNKITNSDKENLVFLGLQGMIDPPRLEVKDAIKRCEQAGIKVIMITGDHALTAKAIAQELGIKGEVVEGQQLDKIDLDKIVENISIYARVNPEHKIKIIDSLQKKGHIVAMTGDGVNDAPALKKADVGVAMGITGTDVSKDASDLILNDDNFASIVNAVEEGRGIFDNIKKFINYLLSSNFGEVLVLFLAVLIGFKYANLIAVPLIAVQLLWMNLITDGLPALALGIDPYDKKIMLRKPRNPKEGIMSINMTLNVIFTGLLIAVMVLILFDNALDISLVNAQTGAFTLLVLLQIVRLYVVRKQYNVSLFSNKYLIGAIFISILLQLAAIYTPLSTYLKTTTLSLIEWAYILLSLAITFVLGVIINKVIKVVTKEID